MKIFYNELDGKTYYAILDRDLFLFKHTTNIPLSEMIIEEIGPANKNLCIDLLKNISPSLKVDIESEEKYKIVDNVLFEKEGWTEHDDGSI